MAEHLTPSFIDQVVIPFWNITVFILIMSLFSLVRSYYYYKVVLTIVYLLSLAWGFSLQFGSLRDSFGTSPASLYIVLAFCFVGLTLFSFIQESWVRSWERERRREEMTSDADSNTRVINVGEIVFDRFGVYNSQHQEAAPMESKRSPEKKEVQPDQKNLQLSLFPHTP